MIRWDVLIHICLPKQKIVCLKFHTMDVFLCLLLVNIHDLFKKKCSKQYKKKTYTINLTHTKNAPNMRVAKPLFLRVRNSEEK